MSANPDPIRILAWDHERCLRPLAELTRRFADLHPGTEFVIDVRSLEAFGDQPLENALGSADLVFIDHPFCGTAAETGLLAPLDSLLTTAELEDVSDAVGPNDQCYWFDDRCWAVPVDAACHVAASAVDIDPIEIRTWEQALDIARSRPGRVAIPLAGAHALCSFLSICEGVGPGMAEAALRGDARGQWAMELLAVFVSSGPAEMTSWEPPQALERICDGTLDLLPLTFGYVTYSSSTVDERTTSFHAPPTPEGVVRGALLGGAGLAVSAQSPQQRLAARFAWWAATPSVQIDVIGAHGGQPAATAAWDDAETDRRAGGFFSATRTAMETAFVRPRAAWWPAFQAAGGALLSAGLAGRRDPQALLGDLVDLFSRAVTE